MKPKKMQNPYGVVSAELYDNYNLNLFVHHRSPVGVG
jgi:hypothetical protein